MSNRDHRELKQRRRRRQRERYLKMLLHLICATLRLFQLIQLVQKQQKKMTNSSSRAHVLHKTLFHVVVFAEDGNENVQKLETHVQSECFSSLTNCFATFSGFTSV